jgi:hypothetical protein
VVEREKEFPFSETARQLGLYSKLVRSWPTEGLLLYNDQRNAQVFLFIYLFTSALHASGFLLAHLQRQVYNFGSGSSLLGTVSAPGR